MRIAFVAPDALTVLLFCKGLIRELQTSAGADIVVFSAEEGRGAELETLGVRSQDLAMDRFFDPVADLGFLVRLTRHLRRERCDAVFLITTKSNVYGAIAARLAGVETVIPHVVGLGAPFVPGGGAKRAAIRAAIRALYRVAGHLSTRMWFTNPGNVEYFVTRRLIAAEKVFLTKYFVNTTEYAPMSPDAAESMALRRELGIGPTDRVVVMVARMIWSKGIREFGEAAALLRDRYPDTRFLLRASFEPGSLDPVPESYIQECAQRANLIHLGFRDDIRSVYAIADLAVLPTYYPEGGSPRALLEPMAMGKPIIASLSADCRSVIEENRNGYLVPARDASALAEAIARLLDDAPRRIRFGAYSREKAERDFSEARIMPAALRALGLIAGPAAEDLRPS